MQTKTYFASSVPAALDVARKELGPEAMLLNSKPAPAESRAFGRLEVTFAYDPRRREDAPRMEPRAPRTAQRPTEPFASPETLRQARAPRQDVSELEELRRQVEALRLAVSGTSDRAAVAASEWEAQEPVASRVNPANPWDQVTAGAWKRPDETAVSIARLVRNGLTEPLARELAEGAAQRGGERAAALAEEVAGRIPRTPHAEMRSGETRVLAFAGPPGRGKTTSLVKIAVKYGIAQRIPVRIYQAGGHGVGCQEQMARYAAIIGVPFLAFESLESLSLSLSGDGWKGLILIDTPGISPGSTGDLQELGRFFSRRPEIERHLTLRADARSADMSYVVSRYSVMGPLRLLFTGVEEALTTGAMVETLIMTGLGSSYAGTGQQIPDDIEELDIPRLVRSVCGDPALVATAAG